jgi:hypothetical protein
MQTSLTRQIREHVFSDDYVGISDDGTERLHIPKIILGYFS